MTKISRVKTFPYLAQKEFVALVCACALICLISALVDAPMEGAADPNGVPVENVKAPWIFVGIQQMLRSLSPELAGIVIPLVCLLILALGPVLLGHGATSSIVFFGLLGLASILTLWGFLY
jgi:hypothetical protein